MLDTQKARAYGLPVALCPPRTRRNLAPHRLNSQKLLLSLTFLDRNRLCRAHFLAATSRILLISVRRLWSAQADSGFGDLREKYGKWC